jgi:hypothetical protein
MLVIEMMAYWHSLSENRANDMYYLGDKMPLMRLQSGTQDRTALRSSSSLLPHAPHDFASVLRSPLTVQRRGSFRDTEGKVMALFAKRERYAHSPAVGVG